MSQDTAISYEIKVKIVKEYVEPAYLYDISSMIKGKRCWKTVGQIFETFSKIFIAISGILSFSSGYFEDKTLSFLAGSVTTISLAMLQFSAFSFKENKKLSDELNIILKKLGLDTIPVLDRNIDVQSGKQNTQINDGIINALNDLHNRDDQIIEILGNRSNNIEQVDENININTLEDKNDLTNSNIIKLSDKPTII
jgi:hypothetical protein